jgi:hypothetical protein
LRQISTALKGGVKPDDFLRTVKAYAAGTEGYTRSKVCFSDNWFKVRRWETGLAQIQVDREKSLETEVKGRTRLASWILDFHPMCRHITECQLEDLLV